MRVNQPVPVPEHSPGPFLVHTLVSHGLPVHSQHLLKARTGRGQGGQWRMERAHASLGDVGNEVWEGQREGEGSTRWKTEEEGGGGGGGVMDGDV